MWRSPLASLVLVLAGCTRTYLPDPPTVAHFPDANAIVDQVRIGAFVSGDVRIGIATRPGTKLWDARLALAHDRACAEGAAFTELEMDGVPEAEGPLDVSGARVLEFRFGGQSDTSRRAYATWIASASEPVFLDLRLEGSSGARACARVPVLFGRGAPRFRLADDSAGFFLSSGGHAYPAGFGSGSEFQPTGDFFLRAGLAFGRFRARTDFGAAFTDVEASRHLVIGAGGDGAFLTTGPWALRAGLGYDAVINIYQPDPSQPGSSRYVLHGPQATLGVGYALIQNVVLPNFRTHPALPAGQRTLSLELEAPMSLWFGTGGAPRTIFAPGIGFDVFWSF